MKLSLYLGNHNEEFHVQDIVSLIETTFKKHGIKVQKTKKLEGKCLVLIDEFSKHEFVSRLLKQKNKNNVGNLILISSEFVTERFGLKSFNNFGNLSFLETLFCRWVGAYYYKATPFCRRLRFQIPIFGLPLFVLLALKLPFYGVNREKYAEKYRILKNSAIMHARYLGFNEIQRHSFLVIKLHKDAAGQGDKVIYPLVDTGKITCSLSIHMSGTGTLHRYNKAIEFSHAIKSLNKVYEFDPHKKIAIIDDRRTKKRFGFSYQPAQSANWAYGNPMKIYRNLQIYGAIPIVEKIFGDHEIEKICLTEEAFLDNRFDYESLMKNIHDYNKLAVFKNKCLIKKLTECF